MRRLLVVDFANMAHRAYFAARGRPVYAPDGRPVFLVGTFLRFVLAGGVERIRPDGPYFEQAIARGSLRWWPSPESSPVAPDAAQEPVSTGS